MGDVSASAKGDNGIVGIVGGSLEYTGAPFFAGMSALRSGADLVYVYTVSDAAPVIKAYAPDLIVIPIDRADCMGAIEMSLQRLDCLVIGPGLGRHPPSFDAAIKLSALFDAKRPVVFDGDGIHLFCSAFDSFAARPIALTPNIREYAKLTERFGLTADADVATLAAKIGNATIVKKGAIDEISDGLLSTRPLLITVELKVDDVGSIRRCGGQGDILAGILAAAAAKEVKHGASKVTLEACQRACRHTRQLARTTFAVHGMSMVARDMLKHFRNIRP